MSIDTVPIRRLASVFLGKMIQPEPKSGAQVSAPYLRAAHVQPGGRIVDVETKEMWFDPLELRRHDLRAGDVVVVEGGAGYGRSACLKSDRPGWGFQNSILRLRPFDGESTGRLINYALQIALEAGEVALEVSTATIPHFTAEKVGAFEIPIAPLVERPRIADFLDDQVARIDEIIRLREQQAEALWSRFEARCASLTMPSSAQIMPLRRVLSHLQTGSTPTIDETDSVSNGSTVDWYTPASFEPHGDLGDPVKRFDASTTRANGLVRFAPDSVLLVGIGATAGRVAYLDHPAAGNQQLTSLVTNSRIAPRFLLWQLYVLRNDVRSYAPFTTLPILNNDFLKSVLVSVPSMSAQQLAAARLDQIHQDLRHAEGEMHAQVDLLRERKRSLITAAVMGEFDVSSASGRGVA